MNMNTDRLRQCLSTYATLYTFICALLLTSYVLNIVFFVELNRLVEGNVLLWLIFINVIICQVVYGLGMCLDRLMDTVIIRSIAYIQIYDYIIIIISYIYTETHLIDDPPCPFVFVTAQLIIWSIVTHVHLAIYMNDKYRYIDLYRYHNMFTAYTTETIAYEQQQQPRLVLSPDDRELYTIE